MSEHLPSADRLRELAALAAASFRRGTRGHLFFINSRFGDSTFVTPTDVLPTLIKVSNLISALQPSEAVLSSVVRLRADDGFSVMAVVTSDLLSNSQEVLLAETGEAVGEIPVSYLLLDSLRDLLCGGEADDRLWPRREQATADDFVDHEELGKDQNEGSDKRRFDPYQFLDRTRGWPR